MIKRVQRKSDWRWLKALAFCCGGIILALPLISHLFVAQYFLPRFIARHEKLEVHTQAILKDFDRLAHYPLFPNRDRVHNAEALLREYVSWSEGGFDHVLSPENKAFRALFDDHSLWRKDSASLRRLASDVRVNEIDTSWMSQLWQSDHWELSSHPSHHQALARLHQLNGLERTAMISNLPLPEFMQLRQWTLIYLIQQAAKGRAIEGLKMQRHVAALMDSTHTLVGAMNSVGMLQDERHIKESLNLNQPWTTVPEETIQAYKRASWAWVAVLNSAWERPIPSQFVSYLRPETGVCSGIREAFFAHRSVEDFLEPKFPGETDFSAALLRSRDVSRKVFHVCRVSSEYQALLSRSVDAPNPIFAPSYSPLDILFAGISSNETSSQAKGSGYPAAAKEVSPLPINLSRIPYIRRLAGMAFLSIGPGNFLKVYDRIPAGLSNH